MQPKTPRKKNAFPLISSLLTKEERLLLAFLSPNPQPVKRFKVYPSADKSKEIYVTPLWKK